MPTVEVPNIGEIDFPDSMSQEDIVSAIKKMQVPAGTLERPASMSPLPSYGELPTTPMPEEPKAGILDLNRQVFSREAGKKGLPVAGGIAGAMTGAGVMVPALMAAAGSFGGKVAEQKISGGEVDLYDATKEGLKTGAGTLAGGLVFKGLGLLANKIFAPKALPKATQRAAKFAERQDLPFPLSSAAPGSRGAQIQSGVSMTTLPARILNQSQARKASEFINKSLLDDIPTVAKQAKPIDQVARQGQIFFQNIINPIKEAGEQGFQKFISTVGNNTPVPVKNLMNQIDDALTQMAKRGLVTTTKKGVMKSTNKLGKYLIGLKESPQGLRTLDDYEVIRKQIYKLGAQSEVKTITDSLKQAMFRDYDEVGSAVGVSVKDLAQNAINKYSQMARFRKEFPDIEFMAKPIDSERWLNLLFTNKNAKALNTLRKDAPDMYRELSDTWLAAKIKTYTRAETGILGKVLDGNNFRKWFESEKKMLRSVLGPEKTQVLDNFSRYAQHMEKFIKSAERTNIGPVEALAKGGAEIAGAVKAPFIMIPGEAGAFVLAKGLSNPNSKLFKLFTEGPGPQFKKAVKVPLMIGGQEAIRAQD